MAYLAPCLHRPSYKSPAEAKVDFTLAASILFEEEADGRAHTRTGNAVMFKCYSRGNQTVTSWK